MSVPRIETLESLPLVDHHCHGLVRRELNRTDFERAMTEADHPGPRGASFFDSQLGFALRRYCAPVLDLPAHAPPDDYLARRAELGADEVATRMLRSAGIADFCVDTGFAPERLTSAADLAAAAGGRGHDVVRLEPLAEQVALDIVTGQIGVAHFPDQVRARLAARAAAGGAGASAGAGAGPASGDSAPVVGVKSVAAYRVGLELPAERPTDRVVIAAVRSWVGRLRAGAPIRLADPVLHSFLIWVGADLGLPVQIHTGYGDTDLHLRRANPLLLTDMLRALMPTGAPVLLLHCYPFHREAGYLAQVFPHVYLDVGLATHNVGRASATVLAEALELAPFGKLLFSTDAFALAELYLLGARLFRRALAAFLAAGIADGDWTAEDADRVAVMVGAGNARRVYGLAEPAEEPAATKRAAAKRPAGTTSRRAPAKRAPATKAGPAKPAPAKRPAGRSSTSEPAKREPAKKEPAAKPATARRPAKPSSNDG
ncbi:amidohydrolase family protein [Pseudofrankia asymbiotica]|uniref:Amidohydrolase n=1 Tax=Pseudofrankia asymbiotica TaxID=1834516 RepID=A0A1V2I172_9ACTN|nr:amidohydrolase family protein [Pseudofrankia asymbiotica]ONH23356.1 amidohydrolase [Pseudofrankia asymbiotica]